MLQNIVENEVTCIIDNIKTNSALKHDGTPSKCIMMAKAVLVPFLTKIYDKCLKEECFRMILRSAMLFRFLKQLHPKDWAISVLYLF